MTNNTLTVRALPSRALKAAAAAITALALALSPVAAQQLDTFTYDFEGGNRQGWGPRGTVGIAVTDQAARSGPP